MRRRAQTPGEATITFEGSFGATVHDGHRGATVSRKRRPEADPLPPPAGNIMAHAIDLDEAGARDEGSGLPPATRVDEVCLFRGSRVRVDRPGRAGRRETIMHDCPHLPTDPCRTEASIVGHTLAGSDKLLVEPLRLGSVRTKCGDMMLDCRPIAGGRRRSQEGDAAAELSRIRAGRFATSGTSSTTSGRYDRSPAVKRSSPPSSNP